MKKLLSALVILLLLQPVFGQEHHTFVFYSKLATTDVTDISETIPYKSATGYGFDFNNKDRVIIKGSKKDVSGYCTAEVPFYFSVKVPEGNYRVKVIIGNPAAASTTTIKAEARRLMVDNYKLKKGKTAELSFNVSVRSPYINADRKIKLKPREVNYMNWDDRLTLEFSGKNQAVRRIEIEALEDYHTIFLAGNSTVTDQDYTPWASWGQMITPYFDNSLVVANYAESGESLASFKGSGRLDKVLSMMKPGDYLFIEFGHNDEKRKGEGIGPWTSYSDLIREFVNRSREKGGIPVLITPTQRRTFDENGTITNSHGDYPAAMKKVAEEMSVPLIDLNAMTKTLYEAWGPESSKLAFVHYPENTFPGQDKKLEDNTHFNEFGAHEIALCVLQGICNLDLPIESNIINFKGHYNPSTPNGFGEWKVPMSPRTESTKPEGN